MPPTPSIAPLQGSTGPAGMKSANPGLEANAMAQVREAVHLLEMALPNLPTGGDQHKATIDSLQKLAKAFPASEEVPGVQNTVLMGLAQNAKKNAMMQAVMRAAQANAQGGGGAPPTGAPGMTPPMAPPEQAAA